MRNVFTALLLYHHFETNSLQNRPLYIGLYQYLKYNKPKTTKTREYYLIINLLYFLKTLKVKKKKKVFSSFTLEFLERGCSVVC